MVPHFIKDLFLPVVKYCLALFSSEVKGRRSRGAMKKFLSKLFSRPSKRTDLLLSDTI